MSIAHFCALMRIVLCIFVCFWALMEIESPEHNCAHNDAIALLYEITLLPQIIKFWHQMELQGTHWWREIDINGTQFAFNILLFTSIIGVFFYPKLKLCVIWFIAIAQSRSTICEDLKDFTPPLGDR